MDKKEKSLKFEKERKKEEKKRKPDSRNGHKTLIKVGAYIILCLGSLFPLAGIGGSAMVWLVFPTGSLTKKVIGSISLVIGGGLIFFLFLSFYEFLMEFLKMEREVERLEQKTSSRYPKK